MSRMILLAVLGLAAAGGSASANPDCPTGECGKYGWNPLLKWRSWFGKKGCDACDHGPRLGRHGLGGHGHGGDGGYGNAPGVGYPGTPGSQMPGTLVFPNHPYARSPRDFFMYEPK